MGILTQGNWHYDIDIAETKKGLFGWVVIRFPLGMTAADGQSMVAGVVNSREEAEREAESARQRIMAADAVR